MMKDGQVVPTTALRAALLLLAVSLAAPLFASDEAPAPLPTKTAHRPQLRQILKQLGLSPAQRHQVAECRASYRKKMAELNGQLKVKQVELENELDKTDPDADRISELTQAIGVLLGKRLQEKVDATLTLEKQILTPQQADQLKSFQPDTSSESDTSF